MTTTPPQTARTPHSRRQTDAMQSTFIRACKRAERELKRNHDGLHAGRLLSDCIDQVIRALWQPLSGTDPANIPAAFAVGGYGRSVRAPHSDVDLTFIQARSGTANEAMIRSVVYRLWDLGLTVNHTVRTVTQSVALAKSDHTIATALLDRRFLIGHSALARTFDEALTNLAARCTGSFISAKLTERDTRHRRHGNSRYLVEPDVKNGKGGLRDLQTLYWIAKHARGGVALGEVLDNGVFTAREARSFRAHARFLWAVRHHMHVLTDRATASPDR